MEANTEIESGDLSIKSQPLNLTDENELEVQTLAFRKMTIADDVPILKGDLLPQTPYIR